MKIQNITNLKGNTVANQFIFEDDHGIIFFKSYNSIIAKKEKGKVFLDVYYWDYSNTTNEYRNLFLGETKKETEKKIKSGEYKLTNLNK